MDKWDSRFMQVAILVSSWSEDQSRKVGSVIVGEGNIILSTGYNGLPRGIDSAQDNRHNRTSGEKYFWFEHAERNAIFNAARVGNALSGSRIYSTVFPCADCTRAIIQCGISNLITFQRPANDTTYQKSFDASLEMLKEAKITIRYLTDDNSIFKLASQA